MKTNDCEKKLKRHGYDVTRVLNSPTIYASKNGKTYKANSLNGLVRVIFGKLI